MCEINSIHDKTFKSAMADIRVARDFLEEYLPERIHTLVDLNTLKLSSNSYVDEDLNSFSSDVLYQVNMENDNIGYIYILVEHQSSVDALMAFRLWNYVCRVWADHIKQTGAETLPLVFPLVFYHGKKPYNGCRNLRGLIQAPSDVIDTLLFKDFHLVDTHQIKDEELRERHWAGIMTFMFKHVYDRDIWPLLQALIEMLKKIEWEDGAVIYMNNLLKYWLVTAETKKGPKAFIEAIQQGLSRPIKGELMTMGEQLIRQGIQQGEGALLMRQLQRKFTIVPESYKQRIEQANTELLLKWGDRVLDATALEEVFKS